MVVLEAMAHGLPVVVSAARYCGIAAELQAGTNAILLDQPQLGDVVASAIAQILSSQELVSKLSANGLNFARSRTSNAVGAQYEKLMHARIESNKYLCKNAKPIPILTYHQIAPTPAKGTPFRSLSVSPSDFANQMKLLKWMGYRGLSMSELMPYLRGEKSGRVVGITFDDGYQNNLTNALPTLNKYGFSSTCYVVSQMVGKTNLWDLTVGIPQVPLLNPVELRLWIDGGQEVGSHTQHHVHLPDLDLISCRKEIQGGKEDLEQLLQLPVAHFCYPYGDYDQRNTELVNSSKFQTATTTKRGRCHSGNSLLELPRVSIVRRTTRLGVLIKLLTRYEERERS
jgi:peptidoglycan/xylan/chitin deacetylase (PgdA/CDA1 family)